MTQLSLPRPAADDAPAAYHGYISEVPGESIGGLLATQPDEVDRLLARLDDRAALARYAPGKWSIKEVVGHLADSERIFAYRLLRIGRGDPTPLPGFDEKAYVPAGRFDQRPLSGLLQELRTVRQGTLALVDALPSDGWTRWGEANGHRIRASALPYIIVGHTGHHLRVLRERYPV